MHQPTIEKLHALRLGAMANALTAQLQQPEIDAMPFAERLALLVDIQHSAMLTAALAQRLTRAGMRQSACMENLDLRNAARTGPLDHTGAGERAMDPPAP